MIVNALNISVQEYWKQVRAIQKTLPEVVKLVSVPDNRPPSAGQRGSAQGAVQFTEAESLVAAELLFAGSHRIATADEIAAQEVKRQTSTLEATRKHLAAQGIVAIQLPSSSK